MKVRNEKKEHSLFLEILTAALMLASAAAVRYFYIRLFINAPAGDGRFLQLAYVRLDAAPAYLSQTVSDLYVRLLRAVFWFAGNKDMAGIWLQAALQTGALFFLYLALRRVLGLLPAVTGTLVLLCWPALGSVAELTPGCLLFLLTGVYLWLLSSLFSSLIKGRLFGAETYALLFLTGVYLGFLISADSSGLFAAAVTLPVFLFVKRPEEGNVLQKRELQFLVLLLGALLGTVGCFLIRSQYYGHTILAPLREYAQNYFTADTWNFLHRFGTGSVASAGVTVCMTAVFAMLAAARSRRLKREEASVQEAAGREITVLDIDSLPAPEPEMSAAAPEPVTLFEKPLPKPKKHVRKEMTYAFDPEEALMKYDIDELPEGSGYDVP